MRLAQQLRVTLPREPVFKLELRTTTDNTDHPLHNLPAWGDPNLIRRSERDRKNIPPSTTER